MELSDGPRKEASATAPDVEHVEIRLRTYQAEMLEASLKENIIVVQDTGSGKTHMFGDLYKSMSLRG